MASIMSQARTARGTGQNKLRALRWIRSANRPRPASLEAKRIRLVDLFCGCGGLTLGVWEAARRHRRRLEIKLAADLSEEALSVYQRNFDITPNRALAQDIAELFSGDRHRKATLLENSVSRLTSRVDLIVAGPPCQGHSDLNNSTRRKDPRNILYLRVIRAVELLRPKAVIIENVPTVVLDKTNVVDRALSWLSSLGYCTTHRVVSLAHFGVPQLRRRHVLVATIDDAFSLDDLDVTTPWLLSAGDVLAGLEDEPELYTNAFYQPSKMSDANKARVQYLFSNNLYDLPNHMRPSCHRDKKHAYLSMYGRMLWDRPAQTLTSGFGSMGQGRYVHPMRKRLLTPHEAARVQGFPDFFDFSTARNVTTLREMIANAVPPQFTAVLVSKLIADGVI